MEVSELLESYNIPQADSVSERFAQLAAHFGLDPSVVAEAFPEDFLAKIKSFVNGIPSAPIRF